MDLMDTSVSLLISAIVGAGVFALPALTRYTGIISLLIIPLAFLYMLGVGHLIIEMFPGTVEEEVERELGMWGKNILVFSEKVIVLLALVAYLLGLKLHLGVSDIMLLSLIIVPMALELHPTSQMHKGLSFFILSSVSLLTLLALPKMELPYSIENSINTIGWKYAIPLFLASIFAFYGHNIIPRIRNILRSEEKTRKAVYMSLSIIFMLYISFAVAVSGLKVSGLATTYLSNYFGGGLGTIIDISSALIFFTSFIILGLHLALDFGKTGPSLVVGGTTLLYVIVRILGAQFIDIVAAAGMGVSIYSGVVALAASKKGLKEGYAIFILTLILWSSLLLEFVLA